MVWIMAKTGIKPIRLPERIVKKGIKWGLLEDRKSQCEKQGGTWGKGKCSFKGKARKGKKKYPGVKDWYPEKQ